MRGEGPPLRVCQSLSSPTGTSAVCYRFRVGTASHPAHLQEQAQHDIATGAQEDRSKVSSWGWCWWSPQEGGKYLAFLPLHGQLHKLAPVRASEGDIFWNSQLQAALPSPPKIWAQQGRVTRSREGRSPNSLIKGGDGKPVWGEWELLLPRKEAPWEMCSVQMIFYLLAHSKHIYGLWARVTPVNTLKLSQKELEVMITMLHYREYKQWEKNYF